MYRHHLFFKNLPLTNKRKYTILGFLSSLNSNKHLLDNNENLCFVWTGNQRIKRLEKNYTPKMQSKLRRSNIEIYLYEPICLSIDGKYNCSFYSEFNSKISYNKVVSEELESIRIFKKKNNLTNVKVYTSDYNLDYLKNLYPDLELYCLDSFIRHITIDRVVSKKPNQIKKKFWCGNWRYTAHRHLVMSYLVHLDGNYSWNLKCSFEDLKKNVWFDLNKYRIRDRSRFNQIKDGVDILNLQVLRIDTYYEPVTVEEYSDVYIPGHSSPIRSNNFLDSYKECFCAIINETRFAQPFGYFSEKTTTAIESRLPVILVAPPRTLEYLKTFGFKTFDRWWDESYDVEEDHEERLIKIFKLIDFINDKSLEELEEIYNEMSDILEHNAKIVKTIPFNLNAL
jgi:hypothetical protein